MADLVAMTDAIPLLDTDKITGRNDARDFRVGLIGALAVPAPNGGLGQARPGVLPQTWNGDGFTDLLVTAQTTASATVNVGSGTAIIVRSGQGPYLTWLGDDADFVTDGADPTNPRNDVLYAVVGDNTTGSDDADHGPFLGVVNGTASVTPTDPEIPADAIPLARLKRRAGDSAIRTQDIEIIRRGTGIGGTWTALEGDLKSDDGSFPGEIRHRWSTGTLPAIQDVWGTDNAWHGIKDIYLPEPSQTGITGDLNPNAQSVVATLVIPDPGWVYRVVVSGSVDVGLTLLNNTMNGTAGAMWCEFSLDSATWSNGRIRNGMSYQYSTSLYRDTKYSLDIGEVRSDAMTGSHTLRMIVRNGTSSRMGAVHAGGSYRMVAKIVPEPA